MKILLTNDDGINAAGLAALKEALEPIADVSVVAPTQEMSGVGHGITLGRPLQVKEVEKNGEFFGYAVSGTPADCVKIAYWAILDEKPDMLISGINHGSNAGINTIYSGTVSAATEGSILNIPSFAISLATYKKPDFGPAAEFAAEFVQDFEKIEMPKCTLLNINVPAIPKKDIQGVRVTRQGMALYEEQYHTAQDPFNRTYYWLIGEKKDIETDLHVDDGALANNYISITPIHFNLTHKKLVDELQRLNKEF